MNKSRLMRRYLLGTATSAERAALEKEYLPNSEVFHELVAAENDLIDSYTRGKLSISEKQAFEKRYLTSVQGQTRVEFARALADITEEAVLSASPKEANFLDKFLSVFRPSPSAPWRVAAACAIVLIAGFVSLRFLNHREYSSTSVASKQADHQLSPVDASSKPQTSIESPTGSPQLLARNEQHAQQDFIVQLEPEVSRAVGSVPQKFAVPIHAAWLNLQVAVEDDEHRPLTAIVQTPEGHEVFRTDRSEVTASQHGRLLRVRVPVARMPAGDYILDVNAPTTGSEKEESVTSCSFSLTYK
jgi:hypothetical protein